MNNKPSFTGTFILAGGALERGKQGSRTYLIYSQSFLPEPIYCLIIDVRMIWGRSTWVCFWIFMYIACSFRLSHHSSAVRKSCSSLIRSIRKPHHILLQCMNSLEWKSSLAVVTECTGFQSSVNTKKQPHHLIAKFSVRARGFLI